MRADSNRRIARTTGRTGVSFAAALATAALVSLCGGTSARALTTMTMDDLPVQQIDGLSHLGVNFGFTVGGVSSSDATYNSSGPGTTTHTEDPAIEGTTDGVVQIDFDNPTDIVEIGFALSTGSPEVAAIEVELFDATLSTIGIFSLDTALGGVSFGSAQFENVSNLCVSRAVVSFNTAGSRFVMDEMTYEETVPCGCTAVPSTCVTGFGKGILLVNEKKPGKEKLTAKFLKGPMLVQSDFGDPVAGSTSYNLCLYDDADALVGELQIDRATDTCGTKDCWKTLGGTPPDGKGFKYKDKALDADGALLIQVKGGGPGKSKALIKAKNDTGTMPTGIAAALNGSLSATMELHPSDGQCISVTVSDVVKDDGSFFKAK